jgi:RNA polymerase sigma-70 factor (ECF subfamily)
MRGGKVSDFSALGVTTAKMDKVAVGNQLCVRRYVGEPTKAPAFTDYMLARAAADGFMSALGALYERHHRQVYSVCLKMTRNAFEAEDMTQEVFIHLVRKVGLFRNESQFSTWLHRLTVNVVLMHIRRRKTRREHVSDDLEKKIPTRQAHPAGAQIADRMALDSALAQLPAGCRRVFVLFDVEGYKHNEIAHLLGCSTGTSKSQLHKARIKLRRLLTRSLLARHSKHSQMET